MFRKFNPKSIALPAATYVHGLEVPPNVRLLFVAGQTGMRPDGSIPASIEEQADQTWKNISAILAEGGMGISDLVKVTSFLTKSGHLKQYGAVRDKYLGEHRPTTTLLVISGLARPEYLVEVEAIAAKV
ncbi:MAG: Rid family hydrolase [Betaproteobacteria bacterium]|nr:Rid family hydrolase [Betaproteobacteria bacterium]